MISGKEPAWLSENLLALKKVLDTIKPQDSWFQRHRTLLLNFIALGIGSLGSLVIDATALSLFKAFNFQKLAVPEGRTQALTAFTALMNLARWPWRWLMGFFWGAFGVRSWFLGLWPNIEFDFGVQHLRIERTKRQRLAAVATLIVLPVVANLITDLIKAASSVNH